MKKIISLLLSFILVFSTIQVVFADTNGSMSNFKETKTYTDGQFSDVSKNDWFAENVKKAYELGLINGTSETTFNPNADITIAETITLASRLNNTYKGNTHTFVPADVWYQPYVDYAIQNGIIKSGEYGDFNAKATRAQFVEIFASSLPNEALKEINTIEDRAIPDISTKDSYATSVYKLYRAGILTGNDDKGTFAPNTNIQRSAVAAIVSRMAIESMRVSKTLNVEKLQLVDFNVDGRGSTNLVKIKNNIYELLGELDTGFGIQYAYPTASYSYNKNTNEIHNLRTFFLNEEFEFVDKQQSKFTSGCIKWVNSQILEEFETEEISLKQKFNTHNYIYKDKKFEGITYQDYLNYELKENSTGIWNGVRFVVNGGNIIYIDYNINDLANFFEIDRKLYIEEVDGVQCIVIE